MIQNLLLLLLTLQMLIRLLLVASVLFLSVQNVSSVTKLSFVV